MARLQRPGVREILLLFVVLDVVAVAVNSLWHADIPAQRISPFWVLAWDLFCVWRVSNGGWISRAILVIESGLSCFQAILRLAVLWNVAIAGLVLIFAVQFVLLVSPPVTARVRRAPGPVLDPGPAQSGGDDRWAGLLALARRPPTWGD